MKKPVKPQRKEYWAGSDKEDDEKRYNYGLKQYADKAEKYIEYLEQVNGVEACLDQALPIQNVVGSYSQEEIEAAYDKGLEDGYACMPSNI